MVKNTGRIHLIGVCVTFAIILVSIEARLSKDMSTVQDMSKQSLASGGDIPVVVSEPVGGDISVVSEPVGVDISAILEPTGSDISVVSEPVGVDVSVVSEPVGVDVSAVSESAPPPPLPQVSGLVFPVPCAVTQFIRLSCTSSSSSNTQITEFCTCTVA